MSSELMHAIGAVMPQSVDAQHEVIFISAFIAGGLSVGCLWLVRRLQMRFCGDGKVNGQLSGVCFDHLNESVFVFRLSDFGVVAANSAACQLYGKPRAEIAEKRIDIVEPRLAGHLDELLKKLSLEVAPSFVARFPDSRSEKTIEFTASRIEFEGEKCILWVGRDITDRLEREIEIRGEYESYRTLFDRSELALVVVDESNGKILAANENARSLLPVPRNQTPVGIELESLIGKRLPSAPARGTFDMRDASATALRIQFEASSATFGGRPAILYRFVQLTALSHRSNPLVAPDTPDVFHYAEEAMLIVDPATRTIINANPAASRLYGFSVAQMEGSSVEMISTDPQGCREICGMNSGEKRDCILRYQRRADGSMLPVICNFSIFPWDGKEFLLCSMRPATVDVSKAIPVFVPQTVIPAPALNHAAIVEAKPAAGKVHVLVVDDEPMVRDVTKRMIEMLGYRVSAASCADEAVALVRNHADIELAILDVTMPDKTGPEIMADLLVLNPRLRVVLCSGYSADSVNFKIGPGGAAAFVQKPFTLDTLRGALSPAPDASRS